MEQINTSYMGIELNGWQNWKKFRDFHKEMGIDYDAHIQKKLRGCPAPLPVGGRGKGAFLTINHPPPATRIDARASC